MFGIIYKITNKISGKLYVGQTIHTANYRWSQHMHEAAEKFNSSRGLVHNVAAGYKNSAKDLHFDFISKDLKSKAEFRRNKRAESPFINRSKSKPIICLSTNTEYSSVREAARKTGIPSTNLHRYLNGERKNPSGLIFKFKDKVENKI
jgi:predicted GIY-YIG superfamily endonuclease